MSNQLPSEEDPTSIGNILVSMGLLTEGKLQELIEAFRASKDELLGEFIVRHTKLTIYQVELAWMKQKRLRGNGRTDEAMVVRLMEISTKSHERVVNGVDELMLLTKAVVK